jgi:hypothetical protein
MSPAVSASTSMVPPTFPAALIRDNLLSRPVARVASLYSRDFVRGRRRGFVCGSLFGGEQPQCTIRPKRKEPIRAFMHFERPFQRSPAHLAVQGLNIIVIQ